VGQPPAPLEQAIWEVKADPPRRKVQIPAGIKIEIPIPGDGVLYPSGPSPYVLVGNNDGPSGRRELWDLTTGRRAAVSQAGFNLTELIALSPDGRYLAAAVSRPRGAVDIWSLKAGRVISRIQAAEVAVDFLDFAGPGEMVTVASGGGVGGRPVTIWDVKTGAASRHFAVPAFMDRRTEALSPGRKYLALFSRKRLLVYDLSQGKLVGERAFPGNEVLALTGQGLAFSPDGTELAGLFHAASRSRLIAWDVVRGEVVVDHVFDRDLSWEAKHTAFYEGRSVTWLPDSNGWLVFGQLVIDRRSGGLRGAIPVDLLDFHFAPRIPIDSDEVLMVVKDGRGRKTLVRARIEPSRSAGRETGLDPNALNRPPLARADWSELKAPGVPLGPVAWEARPDPARAPPGPLAQKPIELHARAMDIQRILFTAPDKAQAVVLSAQAGKNLFAKSQVRVDRYSLTTGDHLGQIDSVGSLELIAGRMTADVSPDGARLAVRDTKDRRRLDIWSVAEGKHVAAWLPYDRESALLGGPEWVAFIDSRRLLTRNSAGAVVLWSLPECKAVYRLDTAGGGSLALSPGRKTFAFFHGDGCAIFASGSGECVGKVSVPAEVDFSLQAGAAAFSSDGSQLAAVLNSAEPGKGYPLLARWDIKTGKLLGHFRLPAQTGMLYRTGPGKLEGQWVPHFSFPVRSLAWWGDTHVLLNNKHVVDLERKKIVWRFRIEGPGLVAGSDGTAPDSRLWYSSTRAVDGFARLSALPLPRAEIDRAVGDP
jgi:WD40 repeat protein